MRPTRHAVRILLWLIPIAFEFVIEFKAISDPAYPTLTSVIRWLVPVWVRAMLLGWIVWHFVVEPVNYPLGK